MDFSIRKNVGAFFRMFLLLRSSVFHNHDLFVNVLVILSHRWTYINRSLSAFSFGIYPDRLNISSGYGKKSQNISGFSPTVGL